MPDNAATMEARSSAAPRAAGPSAALARIGIPLSVVVLTFAFFSPMLSNGFVDWDDVKLLIENGNYRAFEWPNIRWMFGTFYMGHYQPLTWLSFALDFLLWGLDPFGYHLTSLLIHCVNALLFYFLALRLLSLAFMGSPP